METLLIKAANRDDYEAEFRFLEASYSEDVDTGALPEQLGILEVMLAEEETQILLAVSRFHNQKRS